MHTNEVIPVMGMLVGMSSAPAKAKLPSLPPNPPAGLFLKYIGRNGWADTLVIDAVRSPELLCYLERIASETRIRFLNLVRNKSRTPEEEYELQQLADDIHYFHATVAVYLKGIRTSLHHSLSDCIEDVEDENIPVPALPVNDLAERMRILRVRAG